MGRGFVGLIQRSGSASMPSRYILSKPNPTVADPAIIERSQPGHCAGIPTGKGAVTDATIRAVYPEARGPIVKGGLWDSVEYLPPPGRVAATSAQGMRRLRALNVVTLCHSWQVQLHHQIGAIPAALSHTHDFLLRAHQAAWVAFTDPNMSDAEISAWADAFLALPADAPTLQFLILSLSHAAIPALPLRWFNAADYSARTVAETIGAASTDYSSLPAAAAQVDFGRVTWTQEL